MDPQTPAEVLIVEDEAITRMVAADAMSDEGMCVHEAGDATEALEVLAAHPEVGLLFTDISLPGDMDGLALSAKVHQIRPDVELIVTSGATALTTSDLPDHGTFVPKPYNPATLVSIVEAKLRG
jgi:DNA-binding NtrC family response regulator